MIVLLVLACLAILVWVFYAASRDQGVAPQAPPPLRPPPRDNPRFRGRQVGAAPVAVWVNPRSSPKRLRNGERVPAVRNGEVVTPADAIGLGCLAPISECTLGDRCICLNRHERQVGGL